MYRVIKTIKGRKYLYAQSSWREGTRIRTKCRSLGPASVADAAQVRRESEQRQHGPTLKQVRRMFDQLCDPARAASSWVRPWGEPGFVNTTSKPIPALDRLVTALGVAMVEHDAIAAHDRRNDRVLLPPQSQFLSQRGYYASLFHEIAHWTGQPGRVARVKGRNAEDATHEEHQNYAREELVAEATAHLVLTHLGYGVEDQTSNALYFQTWLGRCDDRELALHYAMREAQRSAAFILAVNTTVDVHGRVEQ